MSDLEQSLDKNTMVESHCEFFGDSLINVKKIQMADTFTQSFRLCYISEKAIFFSSNLREHSEII